MAVLQAQGTPVQAPPPPPVPALPARAGAATAPAGGVAAESPQATRDQIRDAARDMGNVAGDPVQNALQAAQNGLEAAQNAARQGEAVVVQPPPYRQESPIPPEVIPIVQTVFGSLIAIILGYPIIRFVTRMLEKRADRSMVRGADVTRQIQQLQQSLDAMAIEIERIGEAQRFQSKLIAERERSALPSGEDRGAR